MEPYFPVNLLSGSLPVSSGRPIVFHGVNKSGSLAMSNVMRKAFFHASRANEFVSHYHGFPKEFTDFADILLHCRTPCFFVSHCIYKRLVLPERAFLIGQFRHPLQRTLSVYGWVKRNHLRKHGSLDNFPDLDDWVRRSQGTLHTQMAQIATGFQPGAKDIVSSLSLEQIKELAIENLDRDFQWFGIAEQFEDSIFQLAALCGIKEVPAWERDTRNQWREPIEAIPQTSLDLISETMAMEIEFYRYALRRFKEWTIPLRFSESLEEYKRHCAPQYCGQIRE